MDPYFVGKRILVTGAGQGIGREIAKTLASQGANVTAISKSEGPLNSLKQEEPRINVKQLDVTADNVRDVLEKLGPFDCLVNNAGVAILEPFLQATEDSFDKVFAVNLKAVFTISQLVVRQMVKNNIKGSIVNVSSQASKSALRDHAIYCSSKGGLDMLSKVMALELGEYGIRVNCVNPTVVLTAMGKLGWEDPSKGNPLKARIPLQRFAETYEVVNAVLFLLSDKSSMVNGTTLPVDGGYLAT